MTMTTTEPNTERLIPGVTCPPYNYMIRKVPLRPRRLRQLMLVGILFGPACTLTATLAMLGAPFTVSAFVASGCWATASVIGSRRLLTEAEWQGVKPSTSIVAAPAPVIVEDAPTDDRGYRYVPDNALRGGPMVYFARPGDAGPPFRIVQPGQAALVDVSRFWQHTGDADLIVPEIGRIAGTVDRLGTTIYGPFLATVATFGLITGVMLRSAYAALLGSVTVSIVFAVIYLTTRLAATITNTPTVLHRATHLAADGVRAKPGDRGGHSRRRANTPYFPPSQHTASTSGQPRTALGNKPTPLRGISGGRK